MVKTGWGSSLIGELILTLIALLCTLVDIIFRAVVFLIQQGFRLFSTLFYALVLASICVVVYLILTGISLVIGPGLHNNLS